MAKQTHIDKVIAQLESEKTVHLLVIDGLQLAIDRLKAQQVPKVPRARKSKALHIERTAS